MIPAAWSEPLHLEPILGLDAGPSLDGLRDLHGRDAGLFCGAELPWRPEVPAALPLGAHHAAVPEVLGGGPVRELEQFAGDAHLERHLPAAAVSFRDEHLGVEVVGRPGPLSRRPVGLRDLATLGPVTYFFLSRCLATMAGRAPVGPILSLPHHARGWGGREREEAVAGRWHVGFGLKSRTANGIFLVGQACPEGSKLDLLRRIRCASTTFTRSTSPAAWTAPTRLKRLRPLRLDQVPQGPRRGHHGRSDVVPCR